jgi:glutamate dehydrogenase/leucine dehydrogenase
MRVLELATVDGEIVFDLDCPISGGGTRMAPDVTVGETALLARAMTYKLAILQQPMGGAKAGIRSGQAGRAAVLARYVDEIRPLVEREEFLTASDLGTQPEDFAALSRSPTPLHEPDPATGATLDAVLTGLGVAVAADAALGGLDGASLAVEGFGKVGGTTVVEAARLGGRIVALSTLYGAVADADGLDVDELLQLRRRHGDRCVEHLGRPVLPSAALYEAEADVLVPGARTGSLDAARADGVQARVVAPVANVPYTGGGLATLEGRGIIALADFVCNAGATIGYVSERGAPLSTVDDVRAAVAAAVRAATTQAVGHPEGAFAGACRAAEDYLRTWRPPVGMPAGPPVAPD